MSMHGILPLCMHPGMVPRMARNRKARSKLAEAGKTTTTAGGFLKKQVYLGPEEWDALRRRAFQEERSHSAIVREALRKFLGLRRKRKS